VAPSRTAPKKRLILTRKVGHAPDHHPAAKADALDKVGPCWPRPGGVGGFAARTPDEGHGSIPARSSRAYLREPPGGGDGGRRAELVAVSAPGEITQGASGDFQIWPPGSWQGDGHPLMASSSLGPVALERRWPREVSSAANLIHTRPSYGESTAGD